MPQEFHVVRCYTCQVFQVQQVKKISKWLCKMCGEKQSLKKEYGRGTGADCRRHVQKLNMAATDSDLHNPCAIPASHHGDDSQTASQETEGSHSDKLKVGTVTSKWESFIEDEDKLEDETFGNSFQEAASHPYLESAEITLSRPERHRGGRKYGGWNSGRKRTRDFDQDSQEQNMPINPAASNPKSYAPSRKMKIRCFKNQENFLPFPQHLVNINSTSPVTNTTEITDETKHSQQSGVASVGCEIQPKWNQTTNSEASKTSTSKPKSQVSSKWGQFLQDVDEEDNTDEDRYLKQHQNSFATSQTWNSDLPEHECSSLHHLNTTTSWKHKRPNHGQVNANSTKPLHFLKGFDQKVNNFYVKPQSNLIVSEETVFSESSENQVDVQLGQRGIFSLEDENLLDFNDDW